MSDILGELGMIHKYGVRRIWHLIRPGRKIRERKAQEVMAAAAQKLIETPITSGGLSIRQMERVMSLGLTKACETRILFGKPPLASADLDRLLNETEGVRREFPGLFE